MKKAFSYSIIMAVSTVAHACFRGCC